MPWGAAAIFASAAASGYAAKKGADAQQQGIQAGLGLQKEMFDIVRADTAPYREVGSNALYKLADILGVDRPGPTAPTRGDFTRMSDQPKRKKNITDPFGWHEKYGEGYNTSLEGAIKGKPVGKRKHQPPHEIFDEAGYNEAIGKYNEELKKFNERPRGASALELDPGYQFRLDSSNKMLDRYQSANRLTGGRAVKEALRYGQDFASNEFGNSVNRLFTLAGFGPGAVSQSASAGQNMANQGTQLHLASGNVEANRYANYNNSFQNALNNYTTYRTYQNWNNRTNQNRGN